MDSCALCRAPIPGEYFRVGQSIACGTCVAKIQTHEDQNRSKYFWGGLTSAVVAAGLCAVALWGVMEVASFVGMVGMFLRGTAVLIAGGVIGSAAKSGSKGRGSRALQIWAALFTYLAWCIALVAKGITHAPSNSLSATSIFGLVLVTPVLPFILLFKNPLVISGIIVVAISCAAAWRATAKAELVSGPF